MERKRNKIWGYIGIIAVIALIIVGITVFMPKEEETLAIEMDDIEIKVGESKEIEYSVSQEKAVCSFKVKDIATAMVVDDVISGVSAGETVLTITARYGNEIVEKDVSVKVSSEVSGSGDNEEEREEPNVDNEIEIYISGEKQEEIRLNIGEEERITITSEGVITKVEGEGLTIGIIAEIANTFTIEGKTEGRYILRIETTLGTREVGVIVR